MTAVHNPPPLSTSALTSALASAVAPPPPSSTPKRERNPPSLNPSLHETMLNDFHPLHPVAAHSNAANPSFQSHLALPSNHYPYSHHPQPQPPHLVHQPKHHPSSQQQLHHHLPPSQKHSPLTSISPQHPSASQPLAQQSHPIAPPSHPSPTPPPPPSQQQQQQHHQQPQPPQQHQPQQQQPQQRQQPQQQQQQQQQEQQQQQQQSHHHHQQTQSQPHLPNPTSAAQPCNLPTSQPLHQSHSLQPQHPPPQSHTLHPVNLNHTPLSLHSPHPASTIPPQLHHQGPLPSQPLQAIQPQPPSAPQHQTPQSLPLPSPQSASRSQPQPSLQQQPQHHQHHLQHQSQSQPLPSHHTVLSSSLPQHSLHQTHALPTQPHHHLSGNSQHQSHQQPSLQPHHQSHQSILLPALTNNLSSNHFKNPDEVEVADDLMAFGGLPSSRPQDMQAALVSSAFQTDTLHAGQDQAVMDALLPEPEQDPLNMAVTLQMPLQIDPHRSIERQVLVTSEAEPTRPVCSTQQAIITSHSSALQTSQHTPFPMHVPQSMAHLSYTNHSASVPHPQVLLQNPASVSAFQVPGVQKQQVDAPPLLMLGRNGARNSATSQTLLHLSPQENLQRQGAVASNQMSIQDLTAKPKSEPTGQESHFSPASPSYSAVTISPPTLLQTTTQPTPATALSNPLSMVASNGGDSPTSVATPTPTPSGLSCPICKTVFTRRYNLKVHMSSKHSARRDYHCQHCPNAFNRGDSLKRHIATTHRGEKKWMCSYCHRNFGQRPHMKMHIDTVHLKKRDHKCQCGKAFGTRYNLTAHQRTHQQTPKKHLCMVCKKSFALKSSLARHQRNSNHTNPDVSASTQQQPARIQN